MTNIQMGFFIFVLASFIGHQVISRVPGLLHTPLMSLTNALSAISLVGSLILAGSAQGTLETILGAVAVIASMTNVVSGFLITDRMLKMFRSREDKKETSSRKALVITASAGTLLVVSLLLLRSGAIPFIYLFAASCFILSLKWLSHPRTARSGVLAGEIGMGAAILATLFVGEIVDYRWIAGSLVLGSLVGVPLGLWVPMTAVPQRTALSHAFGALAVGLVGTAEFYLHGHDTDAVAMTALGLEVLLGFLTFTGSLIAAGKLQGLVRDKPWIYRGQNIVNLSILFAGVVIVALLAANPGLALLFPVLIALALIFGVMLVIRIGGADMPTVISLLNSYAGLSACMMGFVLNNPLLIIAGALDGSSGLVLSIIMCKAMNRSFTNVLFGGFGAETKAVSASSEQKTYRSTSSEETAMLLHSARTVAIVPGYGMAAAQAQHKIRELSDLLRKNGADVKFAIHPVAGRMPGHMNVLLAEANISYEQLYDLDQINGEFEQTDIVLVVGANDVVNPAARTDTHSPIFGMPILDVDRAQSVIVMKRSMNTGFAGVDNELFYLDKTQMLFGDAKSVLSEVVDEVARSSK